MEKSTGPSAKSAVSFTFHPELTVQNAYRPTSSGFRLESMRANHVHEVEAAPLSFIERAPYMLGLAQFTEGPKVFAWIDNAIAESEVSIGMKLRLRILQLSNGNLAYTLVKEDKIQ